MTGFNSKREAAADKLQEPPSEWAGIKAILDEYGLQAIDFVADFKTALAQPPLPVQEPVGSLSVRYYRGFKAMTNTDFDYTGDLPEGDYELYTAAPQRPWVGLTDEDIADCMEMSIQKTCRAVETKLKERNS